ncbi:interleukin-like EMT inducer domain-containing protein [Cohnella herbarum]|uniref:ILEI/PANDER domain-containing protein n=1 Tax=Cohnella herbarum TaxID=2728023 RepID=A0A7Z2VLZ0_9BACL|nr:interleukin-like EMT inducer domain-containing protein [Cohnella herbarum]QJD85494.1 hypothetical protein HH215_21460 [Cohnella herbarum]
MFSRMHDLSLLEKESIYIPLTSMLAENKDGREQKVYTAYCATIYRQYGIWMQSFSDLVLEKNDKPIYFHASNYIPYLVNQGYQVEVVEGCSIVDYLGAVTVGSYVILSVKDEGSQQINEEIVERLREFGITQMDKTKLRHSFIWIARKKDGASYEVLHEACSTEQLCWEGFLGEALANVASGGALSTNLSRIEVNGIEQSMNQRGFNIVICSPDLRCESRSFDTFVTLYAEGSLFRANPPKSRTSLGKTISHSGGRIDGVDYTNCKEALEHSYAHRGHRVFEVDMEITSDAELVLRHDWESYLYHHLQQQQPEGIQDGQPLTLEQFSNLKIMKQYTPMTIVDLFRFLASYPDAQVVTDTIYIDPRRIEHQFRRIVEAAAPFGYNVLLRIIPQLYTEDMYSVIEKIFPFTRYIYTLYQTKATDDEVVKFVRDKKVKFVACLPERYSRELGKQLKSLGASVFIHTINELDTVREYIHEEVGGFYTDALSSVEVEQQFLAYQVELDTRREMLSVFLAFRFGISEDEALSAFNSVNLRELASISERLFQSQTLEEAYSLLR